MDFVQLPDFFVCWQKLTKDKCRYYRVPNKRTVCHFKQNKKNEQVFFPNKPHKNVPNKSARQT